LWSIIFLLVISNYIDSIEKARAEKHDDYTMPVQEVKEQVRSNRISISGVGEAGSITYYIVKDLNNGQEYLVGKLIYFDKAGVSITRMER
jgi:sulfate adenylyltransferase subunit 1 (EFTu-like GTPase family)